MTLDQGLGVTHIVAIVDLGQDLVQGVTEDIPALDRTHDPGLDPEVVHPLSQEDKVLLLFSPFFFSFKICISWRSSSAVCLVRLPI